MQTVKNDKWQEIERKLKIRNLYAGPYGAVDKLQLNMESNFI